MKFLTFLKKAFTEHISIKILAAVLAAVAVIIFNAL